jgi:hypothetical protein
VRQRELPLHACLVPRRMLRGRSLHGPRIRLVRPRRRRVCCVLLHHGRCLLGRRPVHLRRSAVLRDFSDVLCGGVPRPCDRRHALRVGLCDRSRLPPGHPVCQRNLPLYCGLVPEWLLRRGGLYSAGFRPLRDQRRRLRYLLAGHGRRLLGERYLLVRRRRCVHWRKHVLRRWVPRPRDRQRLLWNYVRKRCRLPGRHQVRERNLPLHAGLVPERLLRGRRLFRAELHSLRDRRRGVYGVLADHGRGLLGRRLLCMRRDARLHGPDDLLRQLVLRPRHRQRSLRYELHQRGHVSGRHPVRERELPLHIVILPQRLLFRRRMYGTQPESLRRGWRRVRRVPVHHGRRMFTRWLVRLRRSPSLRRRHLVLHGWLLRPRLRQRSLRHRLHQRGRVSGGDSVHEWELPLHTVVLPTRLLLWERL